LFSVKVGIYGQLGARCYLVLSVPPGFYRIILTAFVTLSFAARRLWEDEGGLGSPLIGEIGVPPWDGERRAGNINSLPYSFSGCGRRYLCSRAGTVGEADGVVLPVTSAGLE